MRYDDVMNASPWVFFQCVFIQSIAYAFQMHTTGITFPFSPLPLIPPTLPTLPSRRPCYPSWQKLESVFPARHPTIPSSNKNWVLLVGLVSSLLRSNNFNNNNCIPPSDFFPNSSTRASNLPLLTRAHCPHSPCIYEINPIRGPSSIPFWRSVVFVLSLSLRSIGCLEDI